MKLKPCKCGSTDVKLCLAMQVKTGKGAYCYQYINKVYYGAIFACGSRKATPSIDNSYVGNPALYERW